MSNKDLINTIRNVLIESRNKSYHKGLGKSTQDKRQAQFNKQAKMDDDDPNAYKPAPGDATGKTKPSKHTKKYDKMFGEEEDDLSEKRIKGLENRIRLLEHESEDRVPYYIVAKAVHEIQNDLKKLHPELTFNNNVYAPDKVGGV